MQPQQQQLQPMARTADPETITISFDVPYGPVVNALTFFRFLDQPNPGPNAIGDAIYAMLSVDFRIGICADTDIDAARAAIAAIKAPPIPEEEAQAAE